MPLGKRWSRATGSHVQSNVPEKGGIYELKSFGELVYIGKAKRDLRGRLMDHLRNRDPNYYRYEVVSGFFNSPKKEEDNHLTRFEQKHGQLPKWNNRDTRK